MHELLLFPREIVIVKHICWERRKRGPKCGESLGRMYHVKPSAGDLYYLRLLLLHVPGATGWDDFLQRAPCAEGEAAPENSATPRVASACFTTTQKLSRRSAMRWKWG